MKIVRHVSLAALALFCVAGCTSTQPAATAPVNAGAERPSFSASQTEMVTAVVEAIDHETREVTLVDDAGNAVTFIAGDNVRNLNQVSVGDILVAEHVETVSIDVFEGDGQGAEQAQMFAAARAKEGEMPGGVAVNSVVIVSIVRAIDLENNTFTLEGPDGSLEEYVAMNPENLKLAEVGDIVAVTITESLAIAVQRAN